jgi:hypothetical protein
MILDLGSKALPKFEHDVCPLDILSSIDELLEVIDIFVNDSSALEESQCL